MKCGPGTPIASRMVAKASEPLASLAKPCSIKPYPTIRRSGMGAQRAIGNRLNIGKGTLRNGILRSSVWRRLFMLGQLYCGLPLAIAPESAARFYPSLNRQSRRPLVAVPERDHHPRHRHRCHYRGENTRANETAKPRTGPVPKKYNMAAATNMVTLESTMVAKARLNPASSAEMIERPICASSRMRS